MIDRAAIAAAREAAEAVEAEARALADWLVAAKADLKRMQRELTVLPGRAADLQASLAAAQAHADAAAQARTQLGPQLSTAQANAASADGQVASIQGRIDDLQAQIDQLIAESGGFDNRLVPVDGDDGGGGGKPNPILERRIHQLEQQKASLQGPLAAAQSRAASAHQALAPVTAQVAAADAAVQAAQADVAALTAQLAQVRAAIDQDNAALPAAEALPAQLRDEISLARGRVAAAWRPWNSLLADAHAELAAAAAARDAAAARIITAGAGAAKARDALAEANRSGDAKRIEAAEVDVTAADAAVAAARDALATRTTALEKARADLIDGDDPDQLVQLVAADVPLVLLPVRLETCFEPRDDAGNLLVRIYPDTVHVSAHEPELTQDELTWGRHFLEQEQAAGTDADRARAAWAQLAGRFGPERAAWIARAVAAAGSGDPPLRSAAWTRPPSTFALPDRWVALGYRDGARRFAALGPPIADTLAVGPDPGDGALADPAAPLGDAAHWLLDFDAALAAGMALRIPLAHEDLAGIDRLVVLGVRASLAADDAAARLSALLDGHHYTDGLALVPTGAPTNNRRSVRAGWSSNDDGFARSWHTERGTPLARQGDGSDASRLAGALGLDTATLAHVDHADTTGEVDARQMATALWPATWGYALDQLLGGLSEAALADARAHVIGHIRSRGPLATLRVGREPYGLLPATSLERWSPLDPSDVDAGVPPLLRALAPAWQAAAASVARVTPDAPIDEVLSTALTMSPVSVRYAARGLALHPTDSSDTFARRQQALAWPRALELDVEPLLAGAGFEPGAVELTGPAVTAEPSEVEPLPDDANYVRWLADSGWEAIRTGDPPAGRDTLLFALLRHAVLRQYMGTALQLLRARNLAQPGAGGEPGLNGSGPSTWDLLQAPVDGLTGGVPLGAYLDGLRAAGSADAGELAEVQAALVHLAALPSASLERLLAEALDVCSHRLDAWATAHAGSRLEALRAERPTGARLGGFGVLYDVRPAPVRTLAEQVARLQTELKDAQTNADLAAQARAQLSPPLSSAQSTASAADAKVASIQDQIDSLQAQIDELIAESGGIDNRLTALVPVDGDGGGGQPNPIVLRRIHQLEQQIASLRGPLATARSQADAADRTLAGVTAQVAAADAAVQAAQATVASLAAQLAQAQAAEQDAIDLATNKGYIHAPSLGQAATAAVLRSGHLAHRREADSPFAIDLSSRRTRLALDLLDGIREGQPLGALLGYRFERGLHEGHPGLELDRFIAILRALAPLDDSTKAEAELRDALARETDLSARLATLQQQLAAERATDQAAKESLRRALAAAQSQLAAAAANAGALSDQLEQAQNHLLNLLQAAGDRDPEPPWLGGGRVPNAGIPQYLQQEIAAATARVRQLSVALDAANATRHAAAASVDDLSGQLGVPDPRIDTLTQAIADLQPELDKAHADVTAAQAKLDELRSQLREQAAEAVVANNVVDGLALRRRWRAGTNVGRWDTSTIPFGDEKIGLPALGTPEQQAIVAELRSADDAVDALGDLLTAESVHHLVQGNPLRAGATVDALSRGDAPPPEPEVVMTPRAGIGVTHRLLVLLDPDGPAAQGWPTDAVQLRAKLEPALEAWAAQLLGPAARVRVRGRYVWEGGEATADATLDVLKLSALDVCATAPAGATEVELRLLDHFDRNRPAGVPAGANAAVDPARDPAWSADVLSLAELMEVARQVRELIAGARPLDARDLALPGEAGDPGVDTNDLAKRAAAAEQALDGARAALDGDDLRAALLRASAVGVPGAVPLSTDPVALRTQAGAVARELDRRRETVAAAADDAPKLVAALGPDWRVLGRVTSPAAEELRAAFAASDELQDGDPLAAVTWLERAAHVREGVARLDGTLLYAESLRGPEPLDLHVAQLPHRPGDRWVALPATPDHPIEGGRLSLVALANGRPLSAGSTVAGLVVDEWTEVVPASSQTTGLSFHFDQPNSRAPHAILLAVPPTEEGVWSLDALEAVVLETLDLAEVRLADPDALARAGVAAALPGAGHYLPAIYLASSPADETVTTDLGRVAAPAPAT